MSYRLHAGVRNDLSGTPFQVYIVNLDDQREVYGHLDADFKTVEEATSSLRFLADALDAAAERAGLK